MIATGWVNPQRFAAWIGHGLPAAFVEHMLADARLGRRCVELVEERFGPVSPSPLQAAMLALDGPGLAELALRAGAVWHAGSIAPLIDGAVIRDLVAAIGPELRLFAIRHLALAPAAAEPVPAAALPGEIAVAGQRCLSAWCLAQPSEVGCRIALRLATEEMPQEPHRLFGPDIVDAVLVAAAPTSERITS